MENINNRIETYLNEARQISVDIRHRISDAIEEPNSVNFDNVYSSMESVIKYIEKAKGLLDCPVDEIVRWNDITEKKPKAGKWVMVICENGMVTDVIRQKDTDTYWRHKGYQINGVIGWKDKK